jgi:hypothetical protein
VREIPDPEIRGETLAKIAEGLARRKLDKQATAVYSESAAQVAKIRFIDNRGVIGGVLIDSLIAVGRFDDARACVPLMPDPVRRLVAYGAIAEAQGRRGRADAARAWIAREAPPSYREILYRRVDDGVLAAVDQMRTQQLNQINSGITGGGAAAGAPR